MKLIEELPLETIYATSAFFDYSHWRNLSPKQIMGDGQTPGLDFSKIDKKNRQDAFKYTFDEKLKLIGELPLETIYATSEFFNYTHWPFLLPETVKKCDFSKIAKDKLSEMVKKVFENDAMAKEVLPNLLQLQLDIIKPHLPINAKKYLG